MPHCRESCGCGVGFGVVGGGVCGVGRGGGLDNNGAGGAHCLAWPSTPA